MLQRVQGDPGSSDWDVFLRYYEPFVRRTLIGMGTKHEDVDDVCQLVLSRLWQELTKYKRDETRARFRTWLTRLIINVAINEYWKRKRAQAVGNYRSETLEELASKSSDLEKMIEEEWQRHVARLALERVKNMFSGNAIDVFLRSSQGESSEAISDSLGISLQSVYVLKNRVKTRLVHEVKRLQEQLEFPDSST